MKRARALAITAALVVGASAAPANGDDTKDCITASTQGQTLRDEGQYRRAQDQFQTCSREVCPAVIKGSCVEWLADLESAWPSVVVNAKDDKGADLVDVTVTIDGAPFLSMLDGKPQRVDPGEHDFHYEAKGYAPVDDHVVVHAGERSRMLSVQFGEGGGGTRREVVGGGGGSHPRGGAQPPLAAWVFGGLAVLSFGVEAAVGIPAYFDRNNEVNTCGPMQDCKQSDIDSIHTRFVVADVFGVLGVASAVVAIYFFATASSAHETPKASRVDVRPLPGGGAAAGWTWAW